jgi:hypothetical protein
MKRKIFAKKLIKCLERSFKIINVDESSFNTTCNSNYGWVKKGGISRSMVKQGFQNITLLAAINQAGGCHYAFIRNSHHQETFAVFMEELACKLDGEDPRW